MHSQVLLAVSLNEITGLQLHIACNIIILSFMPVSLPDWGHRLFEIILNQISQLLDLNFLVFLKTLCFISKDIPLF